MYSASSVFEGQGIRTAEYGWVAQVEMVTYKWPSWLHRQTEKQRIIWAYKILFLDVLFPLNVSRIIFCDSDQIIRTDLVRFFYTFCSSCVLCLHV